MDHFRYRDRVLFCEDVPARQLAATYGTPVYVYDAENGLLGVRVLLIISPQLSPTFPANRIHHRTANIQRQECDELVQESGARPMETAAALEIRQFAILQRMSRRRRAASVP